MVPENSIDSGNGLLPVLCQAITWTSADLLSIVLLGKKLKWNFIHETSWFENVVFKISAIFFRSVLTHCALVTSYVDRDLGQHWLNKKTIKNYKKTHWLR